VLGLARFRTSAAPEAWTSLGDYVARMKEGQDAIYYIAGDDPKAVATSPHLEGFRKRGIEVLLLSDPVDEFWVAQTDDYEGKKFRSVTRGAADLAKFAETEKKDDAKPEDAPDIAPLLALFRLALGDSVKDVRASERLAESAVCLVADDADIDIHLERMLRQHKQLKAISKRILEVNPSHALIKALAETVRARGENQAVQARVNEVAKLLLDQARIVEGERLDDPADFARRMAAALAEGFAPG